MRYTPSVSQKETRTALSQPGSGSGTIEPEYREIDDHQNARGMGDIRVAKH